MRVITAASGALLAIGLLTCAAMAQDLGAFDPYTSTAPAPGGALNSGAPLPPVTSSYGLDGWPLVANANIHGHGRHPLHGGAAAPIYPNEPTVIPAYPSGSVVYVPGTSATAPYTQQQATAYSVLDGFAVFGEFLYLKPRGADVAFAVPQDGLGAGAVPMGEIAMAEIEYSPAFRLGAALAVGQDARLVGAYSWFDNDSQTTASAESPLVINPLVLFPGTFNAGFFAEEATANYTIDYTLIDLDYVAVASCTDRHWWGYIVGGRYAELNQDFSVVYPFDPPDGTTSVDTTISFQGAGPRLGLEGERVMFPERGWRVYGRGVANLLVGDFTATFVQENQFNGIEVDTSYTDNRIVPLVDLELGIAWLGHGGRLRLSGGYLVSAWFNMLTTPTWIDSVHAVNVTDRNDVLTFDGLTARAEWRF
ncbi:MAG: Lpg1974 family pore-forming outer membrane protein [Pirellulales bacterium]